jgi:hypothetical protein
MNPATLSDAKHIPEFFYSEFVPKDDAPPFTLLPAYVPPPLPPGAEAAPVAPGAGE